MDDLVRSIPWPGKASREECLRREWLVTNGLGGYASGTVVGIATRRYHGLLVAALPDPLGRRMMLNHLFERLGFPNGDVMPLAPQGGADCDAAFAAAESLAEFRLEGGLPVWTYAGHGIVLERRVYFPHQQNTVHIQYRLLSGTEPLRLELLPGVNFRSHDAAVSDAAQEPYLVKAFGNRYEIGQEGTHPPLRLMFHGENTSLTLNGGTAIEVFYWREANRGYDARGTVWNPGVLSVALFPGRDATLVASTEPWEVMLALAPEEVLTAERERREGLLEVARPETREKPASELVLTANSFIITPARRVGETARARAAGHELRTVIAGYHWFTDWGRDTMISLEGLTLLTGRPIQARWILRTFARHMRDGLIPNLFPEGRSQGLYHTADATLWFFHALDRYLHWTDDHSTFRRIYPQLVEIMTHHLHGTRFGIGADAKDGLLRQGAGGYQLTWMDAKVGDWVVTPRRGKAVEINALWYNALRLMEQWAGQEQGDAAARDMANHAEQVWESFNRRFWYEQGGHLYDVVDGEQRDDPACRPNQLFAISLPHAVLDPSRWKPVLDTVHDRLLTPVGLRSLAPGHADYKPRYFGDLRARDAAYHQGTVWAWLIGPFIDAWLKVYPEDRAGARRFLAGFEPHLSQACVGSISEIFDAEGAFTARGCISQAWSVAEVLRAWVNTA